MTSHLLRNDLSIQQYVSSRDLSEGTSGAFAEKIQILLEQRTRKISKSATALFGILCGCGEYQVFPGRMQQTAEKAINSVSFFEGHQT